MVIYVPGIQACFQKPRLVELGETKIGSTGMDRA